MRGQRVIARANQFLDEAVPLANARWENVTGFDVEPRARRDARGRSEDRAASTRHQFVGFRRNGNAVTNVLLRNHGLHIDIVIDPSHPIGKQHPAGVKDVVLESALTTIMDCEDSVAAVDAADKTVVYRNWCGIMRGTLQAAFAKGGTTVQRSLTPGPRVHRTERRAARAARPQPAARAPRRLAHDNRRRHRRGRPDDTRRRSSTA